MTVLLLTVSFFVDGPGACTRAGPGDDGGTLWGESWEQTWASEDLRAAPFGVKPQKPQWADLEHGAEKMLRLPRDPWHLTAAVLKLHKYDSWQYNVTMYNLESRLWYHNNGHFFNQKCNFGLLWIH